MQEALQSLRTAGGEASRVAVPFYEAVLREATKLDETVTVGESFFTLMQPTEDSLMQYYSKATELCEAVKGNSVRSSRASVGVSGRDSVLQQSGKCFPQLAQDIDDAKGIVAVTHRFNDTLHELDGVFHGLVHDYVLNSTPQADRVVGVFNAITEAAPLSPAASERYVLEHLSTLFQRLVTQLTQRRERTRQQLAEALRVSAEEDAAPELALFRIDVATADCGEKSTSTVTAVPTSATRFALSRLISVSADFLAAIRRSAVPLKEAKEAAVSAKDEELSSIDRYDPRRPPLQEAYFDLQREATEVAEAVDVLAALEQQLGAAQRTLEAAVAREARWRSETQQALHRRDALASGRSSAEPADALARRSTQPPTAAAVDLVTAMTALAREEQASRASRNTPQGRRRGREEMEAECPQPQPTAAALAEEAARESSGGGTGSMQSVPSPLRPPSPPVVKSVAPTPAAAEESKEDDEVSDAVSSTDSESDAEEEGEREYSLRRGGLLSGLGALFRAVVRRAVSFDDDEEDGAGPLRKRRRF